MQENEKQLDIGRKVITSISMTKEQLEILDLICLGCENTRSAVIIDLIESSSNIDKTIETVAYRIVANYSKKNIDFDPYLNAAKTWLVQKRISAYHIERIIEEAKKIHGT